MLLDLGHQVGQPQEPLELGWVDSDLSGQRLLGEIGVGDKASLEGVGLLEQGLNARRPRLAGALSENCQTLLKDLKIDDFMPPLGCENYPEISVVPQNKGLFQFSLVFVQRRMRAEF